MSLAQRGETSHPVLAPILLARQINQALGGAFVAPWEVDQLDEGTIQACVGLTQGLWKMQEGMAEVERIFARWRNAHPTYRK